MKKILLTFCLMIGMVLSSNTNAQTPFAVSVQGGYSWINGVVGGDVQIGHFGFGGGWMPTSMPLSGTKVNSIGFHVSAYSANYDQFGYYVSLGAASDGYRYEDSWGGEATESVTILMAGARGGYKSFFWKAGVGYGWFEGGGVFTGEFTIGIPLFKRASQE